MQQYILTYQFPLGAYRYLFFCTVLQLCFHWDMILFVITPGIRQLEDQHIFQRRISHIIMFMGGLIAGCLRRLSGTYYFHYVSRPVSPRYVRILHSYPLHNALLHNGDNTVGIGTICYLVIGNYPCPCHVPCTLRRSAKYNPLMCSGRRNF